MYLFQFSPHVWYAGLDGVPTKPAYWTVTYIEWHIPDVVLIQLTLLMMSTWLLETCGGNWNKYIRKKELCVKLVIYKDHLKLRFAAAPCHKPI